MAMLLKVLLLALYVASISGQNFGNIVVDCRYSPWTEYIPDPHNSALMIRTRYIAVLATNGGQKCTGQTTETVSLADLNTHTLSKFLSFFIPGDRRTVSLGTPLGRGQVPQQYTLSRDIVLVVDTTLFELALPLYKSLLSNLVGAVCGDVGFGPTNNMFSIITYDSRKTGVLHYFHNPQTKAELQNKILGITVNPKGNTSPSLLGHAMRLAHEQITNVVSGTRGYNLAHKDVVLFVTYRTVCWPLQTQISNQLKVDGRVYVVVLGESGDSSAPPNPWCLKQFASAPVDSHFLWVKSYDDLKEFASWALEISSYLNPCDLTSPKPVNPLTEH